MTDLNMSQLSQSSTSSTDSVERHEQQNQLIVDRALQSYVLKQRRGIKTLNRNVAKSVKDRDTYVKELEANSLLVYEQAVKATEEYFAQNKGTAVEACKEVVTRLSKTCDELLVGLNRESEMIDPDDAEKEADEVAKCYSEDIQKRKQWRRQLVKDNYSELQQHEASVQEAINAKELAKATMIIMKANMVD